MSDQPRFPISALCIPQTKMNRRSDNTLLRPFPPHAHDLVCAESRIKKAVIPHPWLPERGALTIELGYLTGLCFRGKVRPLLR